MYLIVGFCNYFIIMNPILKIIVFLIIGVLSYFALCFVFNVISIKEVKSTLKNVKLGNKN